MVLQYSVARFSYATENYTSGEFAGERKLTCMTKTGQFTSRILSIFCKKRDFTLATKYIDYEKLRENKIQLLTLKISNQNVTFTGYRTRMPERIALWRTTPCGFCNCEARCNVGPLPTDWPYKMSSSCFMPYSFFKQSYTASMSQYVLNSDGFCKDDERKI